MLKEEWGRAIDAWLEPFQRLFLIAAACLGGYLYIARDLGEPRYVLTHEWEVSPECVGLLNVSLENVGESPVWVLPLGIGVFPARSVAGNLIFIQQSMSGPITLRAKGQAGLPIVVDLSSFKAPTEVLIAVKLRVGRDAQATIDEEFRLAAFVPAACATGTY